MIVKKEKNNLFKEIMLNCLWILGYCVLISVLCTLFLFAEMDELLRFGIGVVLMLPLCVLIYSRGNIMATKEFVKRNPAISPEKSKIINKVPLCYSILTLMPFLSIVILLALLGSLIPSLFPLQSIALYITLPVTMCFKAVGLIPAMDVSNPYALLCIGVFFIIIFSIYFYGYIKAIREKEISFQQMINEMNYNRKI